MLYRIYTCMIDYIFVVDCRDAMLNKLRKNDLHTWHLNYSTTYARILKFFLFGEFLLNL